MYFDVKVHVFNVPTLKNDFVAHLQCRFIEVHVSTEVLEYQLREWTVEAASLAYRHVLETPRDVSGRLPATLAYVIES